MTLQDLSLLAQVFGVLLVSGSLIFVGLQMRQTHAVERANAQRHLLTQWQEWVVSLSHDAGAFDDVRDCLHDYFGSPPFKRTRFFGWAFFALFICEQGLYQSREGLINKTSFDRMIGVVLSIIATPGGRQWWTEASQLVGPDISAYLNRQLAGGPESLPPPFHEMATHYARETQGARP